jgi:hypothetical protein
MIILKYIVYKSCGTLIIRIISQKKYKYLSRYLLEKKKKLYFLYLKIENIKILLVIKGK